MIRKPFYRGLVLCALAAFLAVPYGRAVAVPSFEPDPRPSRPPRVGKPILPTFQPTDIPASDAQAARFLTMATFGPTASDIALVRQIGYRAWIAQQLALPASLQRPYVESLDKAVQNPGQSDRMEAWFDNAVTAPDQLRQRIAWALSQILVVSDQFAGLNQDPIALAEYYDTLARDSAESIDAGGVRHAPNYYNLIYDVTLSPSMSNMLSYLRNKKGDTTKGTSPDENYAREVMQLFTIGLVLLNPDGSQKLDGSGQPIPTYAQAVVTAYARIFTGLSYTTGFGSNPANYQNWSAAEYAPLICYDTYHDFGAKTLVSYTGNYGGNSDALGVPANNSCMGDLQQGLAILVNHPNVAPFISKQLIQRFVTSNPTPAYVARVSAVFGRSGGNLSEVVSAILTDSEALTGAIPAQYAASYVFGKPREPLLKLTALWRYYHAAATTGLYTFSNPQGAYVQRPQGASSVFNYYSPSYQPPGEIADSGTLVGPEFQIINESTVATAANDLTSRSNAYVGNSGNKAETIAIDLSSLTAIANDPNALADQINHDLMYGSMSAAMKASLVKMITAIPASSAVGRAQAALQLTLVSPEFAIQK
ncbi:MAG: DUF1800 family protein [Rudaea sp.]